MYFPKSRVNEFYSQIKNNGQRLGQQFYDFMKLDKCSERYICDKIYELDGPELYQFIERMIDNEA